MKRPDWPPAIARYERGNTGTDHVWSFAAALDGPHVMVNCLTHGNEPCGAAAIAHLLDTGVRPERGRLTLSFANVEAYAAYRAGRELPARYLDWDLNRLWRDDWIDADMSSREARRARSLRAFVRSADALLDLHSTASVAQPFFVIADLEKTRRLADKMALPPFQQLMPGGCAEGRHLIDYGRFSDPDDPAVAITVECGRHKDNESADIALAVVRRFLAVLEIVRPSAPTKVAQGAIRRYRTVRPYVVRTSAFRLEVPEAGFVHIPAGQRVATDGEVDVLAPFEAVIVAPRPNPQPGSVAFLWSVETS